MRQKHVIGLVLLALAGAVFAPAGASAEEATAARCVTVLSGGDIGEEFCLNEPGCLVAEYRTTFLGTERYCWLAAPAGAATTTSSVDAARCVSTGTKESGSKYCVDTEGSCTVYEYRWGPPAPGYYCHARL